MKHKNMAISALHRTSAIPLLYRVRLAMAVTALVFAGTVPTWATTVASGSDAQPLPLTTPNCLPGSHAGANINAMGCNTTTNGNNATAIGTGASAIGESTTAIGNGASAANPYSTAIGFGAVATGANNNNVAAPAATPGKALAVGYAASATGEESIAIGERASSLLVRGIAIGSQAKALEVEGYAIGTLSEAEMFGQAFGYRAKATDYAVALGYNTRASALNSVAVGTFAEGTARESTAVGYSAKATAQNGLALGNKALSSGLNSVAIGSISDDGGQENVVSVGSTTTQRRLINLNAGIDMTDGVNVSQLKSVTDALGAGAGIDGTGTIIAPSYHIGGNVYNNVGDALTEVDGRVTIVEGDITDIKGDVTTIGGNVSNILNGTAGIVRQVGGAPGAGKITVGAETGGTVVSVTGTDGNRKIEGVYNGEVSVTSDEAVNGSQLFGVSKSVADALGGTSTVTIDGTVVGPTYNVQGSSYTTVYDAFTAVDGNITTINTSITGLSQDALQWNAVKGAYSGNHMGNGTSRITDVAAGEVSATSTDAINGSQIHGFQTAIGDNTTNIALIDNRVTTVEGNVNNILNGTAGLVQQVGGAPGNGKLTVGAATGGTVVDFAGTEGDRVLTGVADGIVSATSTDAVNGSQLHETNVKVDQNTTAINNVQGDITDIKVDVANIDNRVTNVEGTVNELDKAAVKYDRDENGDIDYNNVSLAGEGGTKISNVSAGIEDMDAVNVGQLRDAVEGLAGNDPLAVRYVGDANGKPTNTVALTGDSTGAAVTITNVAAGKNDTDAVNFSQIKNNISYDVDVHGNKTNTLTLSGKDGAAVVISNVADGVKTSDAVNLGQLNKGVASANSYTDTKVNDLREYTDNRFNNLSGDIRDVRNEARSGIASAMAAAQLRYDDRPGKVSVAGGLGGFKDKQALAVGLGWTNEEQNWRLNGSVGVGLNDQHDVSWGVGASYTFN